MISMEETPVLPILLFNVGYDYLDSSNKRQESRLEIYYLPDSDSTCVSENFFGRKKSLFYKNAIDLTKYYEDSSREDDEGVIIDVKKRIAKIIKKKGNMDWQSIGKELVATYT